MFVLLFFFAEKLKSFFFVYFGTWNRILSLHRLFYCEDRLDSLCRSCAWLDLLWVAWRGVRQNKKKRPDAYFLRYRAKSCFWDASGGISRIPLNGRDQLWQPECGTDVPSRIFGVKVNFGVKDVVYNIMLNISDGLQNCRAVRCVIQPWTAVSLRKHCKIKPH